MSVTLSELIETIEEDPSAVREALELIKRTINDLPTMTEVSDSDAWAIRDAAQGVDQRVTFAALRSALDLGSAAYVDTGTDDDEVPTNADLRVDTLSDLQALDTDNARSVQMLGRSEVGDGGAGLFVWDDSDLSSEVSDDEVNDGEGDGGIYVAPESDKTGASGAWVRQYSGRLNIKFYTGDVDGSDVTSELLIAIARGDDVFIPNGIYAFSQPLVLETVGQKLIGESRISTVLKKSFDGKGVRLEATAVGLSNINVESDGTDTSSDSHGIDNDSDNGGKRWVLENVSCNDHSGDGFHLARGNLAFGYFLSADSNGQNGIYTGGVDANALTLVNLDLKNNSNDGLHNSGSYQLQVYGGYAAYNGRYGFFQDDAYGVLLGVGGEANEEEELYFGSDANYSAAVLAMGDYGGVDINDTNSVWDIKGGSLINLRAGNVLTKVLHVTDNDISGTLSLRQNPDNRDLVVEKRGTSADCDLDISNLGSGSGIKMTGSDGNVYLVRVDSDGNLEAVST